MRLIKIILIIMFLECAFAGAQSLTTQEKEWLTKAYRYDKNGWIYLHIEGKPFERGFQRGYLTANEIEKFYKAIALKQKYDSGKEIEYFVDAAARLFKSKVSEEYVQEMKGIAAGMEKAGAHMSYEQMLLINGFVDVLWHWWPQQKEKMKTVGPGCSAFIATGDATADGKIVMAHNSWDDYMTLQFCNIIIEIVPDKGNKILMQTWGPSIYSTTDFFITSAGIIGTETTIGDFSGFDEKGTPIFERARRAMQYATTIDEWAKILIEHNSGAYANSWLLGDINTNEIARLELGLKHHSLEKKKSGYFTGSNVPDNLEILRDETTAPYDDARDFRVARRVRWGQLMKEHYGKIDIERAKKMLADHYDIYLEQDKPTCRDICGHWELDNGMVPGTISAYFPGGAIDGKVVDSTMAKNWSFWAKWGHSCDLNFNAKEFLEKHPQFDWMRGFLPDLPPQPWTLFPDKNRNAEK